MRRAYFSLIPLMQNAAVNCWLHFGLTELLEGLGFGPRCVAEIQAMEIKRRVAFLYHPDGGVERWL